MAMTRIKRALRDEQRDHDIPIIPSAYEPIGERAQGNAHLCQGSQRVKVPSRRIATRAAFNDNIDSDIRLDQYYTKENVAASLYAIFREHFDPTHYQMVEPSAGTGSFLRLLPLGSLAYDVEPKFPGTEMRDFLTVKFECDQPVAVIGNPPFGRAASMAVRFFNHAASQSNAMGFIVPRSFRKASIENRLDPFFHKVREETVPDDAFIFRSKPYNVPAVFQIWERRAELRSLRLVETQHPDFQFTTADRADFVIQRVGHKAGRLHHNLKASPSSHYFIRGDVEAVMRQLDFASVVGNVAGNPSLAKSELIALYRAWTEA